MHQELESTSIYLQGSPISSRVPERIPSALRNMKEARRIRKSFDLLCRQKAFRFPRTGYVESLGVPDEQGVYIIYGPQRQPAHVGRTLRGKLGLRQRLNQHMLGQSSFVKNYKDLEGSGKRLRGRFWFRYLPVENDRARALVESLGVGLICPEHLGLGGSKKERISKISPGYFTVMSLKEAPTEAPR